MYITYILYKTFLYVHVEKINLSYCLYVNFCISKKMIFLDLMFNSTHPLNY